MAYTPDPSSFADAALAPDPVSRDLPASASQPGDAGLGDSKTDEEWHTQSVVDALRGSAYQRTPGLAGPSMYRYANSTGNDTYAMQPPAKGQGQRYQTPNPAMDDTEEKNPYGFSMPGLTQPTNAIAGAYSSLLDQSAGITQHAVSPFVSDKTKKDMEEQVKTRRELNAGLYRSPGGAIGSMVPPLLESYALPASALGQTTFGALYGGLQPTAPGESALLNAATEGASSLAGAGGGKLFGAPIHPVENRLSDTKNAAVEYLRSRNIPLNLADQTGSPVASALSRGSTDNAYINNPRFDQDKKEAFTREALSEAGINDTEVSPDQLQTQKAALGARRQEIYENNPLNRNVVAGQQVPAWLMGNNSGDLDNEFDGLIKLARRNGLKAGPNPDNPISIIETIRDRTDAQGNIDPVTLNAMRMRTSELSQSSFAPMRQMGESLADILDRHVMEQAAMNGNDVSDLLDVNTKLRNVRAIGKATREGTDDQIQPGKLANVTKNFRTGSGLAELGRAGKAVMTDPIPPSGTFTRLMGAAAPAAAFGAASSLWNGDTDDAWKYALAAGLLPLTARGLVQRQMPADILGAMSRNKLLKSASDFSTRVGAEIGRREYNDVAGDYLSPLVDKYMGAEEK